MRIEHIAFPGFNPRTHKGCDMGGRHLFGFAQVSIHAPTKGATDGTGRSKQVIGCFNPRTHKGCDLSRQIMA